MLRYIRGKWDVWAGVTGVVAMNGKQRNYE